MNSCCWHAAPSAVTIFRFTPALCLSISLVFHLTLLEQFQIDAISQQLRLHHKSHSIYFLCFHHSCCCCSCRCLLAFWLSVQIGFSERTDFLRKMAFTWQLCAGILILLAVKTITHTHVHSCLYMHSNLCTYYFLQHTYTYLQSFVSAPNMVCSDLILKFVKLFGFLFEKHSKSTTTVGVCVCVFMRLPVDTIWVFVPFPCGRDS